MGQMENTGNQNSFKARMLDLSFFKNEQMCIMKNLQDIHLRARTSLERGWLFLERLGQRWRGELIFYNSKRKLVSNFMGDKKV